MTDTWVSPLKAAELLGVSERTVWRRIKASELESRADADGRREVRINTPDTSDKSSDKHSDTVSVVRDQAERQLQVAATAVGLAEKHSDYHMEALGRSRRIAIAGWAMAFVLLVTIVFGAWYTARQTGWLDVERSKAVGLAENLSDTQTHLTNAESRVVLLADKLDQANTDQRQLTADLATARLDLHTERTKAENLKNELKAKRSWWRW